MRKRRAFLKLLGKAAFLSTPAAAIAATSQPGRKSTTKPRFTRRVRELTRKTVVRKGRWKMIVCHHSGIKSGNAATYDREHRKRGMENGLAYHFVIGNGVDSANGEIEIGSRWRKQIKGGHVRSDAINEIAIGICLVGNFDKTKPMENQIAALCELVTYLRDEVMGRSIKLKGHNEAHPGHTACPGRYFPLARLHRLYG